MLLNTLYTLTTYHSFYDNVSASSMSITVDGKKLASGIKAVSRVSSDADASKGYVTFNAEAGKTVTVLISPEGNGSYNNTVLNAFEIDSADPVNSISRITPADGELHHEQEKGLSWTAGKNAVSHNVYFGTSYSSVFSADTSSPEFKGNQTYASYALNEDYDSLTQYFWRVDEVDSSGNVTKGDVYSFYMARLAFPTAEGYGRFARGGRGGRIVEVTNLNDSGEGSLRQALEVEKGPRIVVFRVGGIIELKDKITIPSDGGDVYIAGQTAPGDGICILKYSIGAMGARDIIIRDLHVRIGDASGKGTDGMGLGSCDNSIVDHCSIAWGTDEAFSSRGAHNITFQRNIIAESLNESVHYNAYDRTQKERHAFAASVSGNVGSFHHNLLVNCTDRNWSLAGGLEADGKSLGGALDISNNVVYNWWVRTTDGGVGALNFVGNYYKMGAVSKDMAILQLNDDKLCDTPMKIYASGNKVTDINGNTKLSPSDDAWKKAMYRPISRQKRISGMTARYIRAM